MKTTCKKSWPMNLTSENTSWILLTTEVIPKIFPNLNVIAHLVVLAGWGSCLLRLAIFNLKGFICSLIALSYFSCWLQWVIIGDFRDRTF